MSSFFIVGVVSWVSELRGYSSSQTLFEVLRPTRVVKTGSDSYTAKRSTTARCEYREFSEMIIINVCPLSQ